MTDLGTEAARRSASHDAHASQRKLSADYEHVGLWGEQNFADWSGGKVDMQPRLGGDGGIDHVILTSFGTFPVDVKTSRKAHLGMLVEASKCKPKTIYVLVQYGEGLIGWQWGAVIKQIPARDTGRGVINHKLDNSLLRPMSELRDVML